MSTPKDSWSSSSSTPTWKYDVFLNFRGEDTRNGFVSHLYAALKQKGISTFKDDSRLERGKCISSNLLEAIEESRFAIVIFSRNYAFSRWCLDELVKIVECKKNLRTTILPVFYNVDPSDVRNQRKTFARAFVKHKNKNINKVQMWEDALKEVANISGWHLQNRSEAEFIQKIVEMVLHKLNNTFSIDTKGLIGIDSQVDKLIRLLAIGMDDVRFIGIRGMGGMGKTTLARVVYSILSNKFEACSFIGNIREVSKKCGLLQLQQSLLYELLMERCMNIQDVDNGVLVIKNRLRHKRILLILDDVTEIDQLKKLAGEHDWFGRGSRVVITTRDEHLLLTHKVDKIYEPTELNYDDALKLFSLKVFGENHPARGYLTLSKSFVQYANGVPLAIEVLGSFLFNRSIEEWKSALGRLKEFPERKVIDVLQTSFDGLDQTEKEIFLNIACFFNQYDKDLVEEILGCLDLYPKIGLARLIDKSLVKLHGNKLWMHDLLREMGRDIVRQECHKEPWKRSRMWSYKDIDNVLAKNMVIEAVEGIILHWPEPQESHWKSEGIFLEVPKPKEAHWNCEVFSKMPNLKLLVICNVYLLHDPKHLSNGLKFLDWSGYPSKFLPSNLLPDELVGLCMCCNNIEQFWTGTKCFDKLKFIQLNESRNLLETPDFNRVPNLEKLVMEDCLKLHTVHPSMGVHRKLTFVNFKGCKSIRNLPNNFEMESLEILILSGCLEVQKLPKFMGNMEHVSQLYLDGTAIAKLLTSIGHLSGLTLLNTKDCKRLACLPSSIFNLKLLKDVNLSGCSKLERLPENLGNAESIVELNLSGTPITKLPSSIGYLTGLVLLNIRDCKSLTCLPSTLFNLKFLKDVDIFGCSKLDRLPENLGNAESLEWLDLRKTAIREVPSSIGLLKNLKWLLLSECKGLSSTSSNKLWYELLPFYKIQRSLDPMDFLLSSLSSVCSLTDLDLSDCNLRTISNDIGSLFSLEWLDLSGNDFVCLPESIIQLSKLNQINLNNCTSLRSLPELPLNIEYIEAQGCTSLEMLADQLKPSDSLEPSLSLFNCFKLVDNQSYINRFLAGIKKSLELSLSQYLEVPLSVLKIKSSLWSPHLYHQYDIVIPGSEIPKWFSHQSMGAEVNIKQPSHLYNQWMGIAVCVVFCSHDAVPHHQFSFFRQLRCSLTANGKIMSDAPWSSTIPKVISDHLWLLYVTPQFNDEESNKLLWEGDANGFSQIGIKIEIMGLGLEVKKCGIHMVYKKDIEDLNRTTTQYSNNSISPYVGLDVLHHNFDNLAVVVECHKVKRSRDDYDGAEPSGEGSSNDIPNPKKIKMHTETHRNFDCEDSSGNKDYDEELSDCEESSESNPDG